MAETLAESVSEIEVEVAYAKPEEQVVVRLTVPHGTTLFEAISLSGLLQRFPEINPADLSTGVFGVVCKPEQILKAGDRVEIYRPLIHDPKEARRQRAMARK
jgi:putative ubiquitin-RnfH superfamily antitoxin RatB of RatAB toxin-antitoxin module